jgi:hypothetical protein
MRLLEHKGLKMPVPQARWLEENFWEPAARAKVPAPLLAVRLVLAALLTRSLTPSRRFLALP